MTRQPAASHRTQRRRSPSTTVICPPKKAIKTPAPATPRGTRVAAAAPGRSETQTGSTFSGVRSWMETASTSPRARARAR